MRLGVVDSSDIHTLSPVFCSEPVVECISHTTSNSFRKSYRVTKWTKKGEYGHLATMNFTKVN